MNTATTPATFRAIPHPYRGLLAICSDLDETPDRDVYREIVQYLNTTAMTSMGPGVGLEVGNSIYFDMPPEQFSYWNTDDAGRAMLRDLVRSGHVDCLHSYGDHATTRAHAGRALDELSRHGCTVTVWIDHAVAPTNFGADIMRGTGDVPGAAAYHADLTCGFGVRHVWRGRVTSVVGQNAARRLGGIWTPRHPVASARTLAKEWVKGVVGRRPGHKYAMHAPNAVLRDVRLRDGRAALEFLRANPYWRAVDKGETAAGLGEVLTPAMLRRLVERDGVCVLYTHLGKIRSREDMLGPLTRTALARLARLERDGHVLVTTTRRLLDYCAALRSASCRAIAAAGKTRIELAADAGFPADGLTVYAPGPGPFELVLNGVRRDDARLNPPDSTGRASVSLPWKRLEFPLDGGDL